MADYQIVKSSLEISMGIVECLEMAARYNAWGAKNRNELWKINDVIQGRGKETVKELLVKVREKGNGWYPNEIERFEWEIKQLQKQKALREQPYRKTREGTYQYEMAEIQAEAPLKIINQKLYDRAVEEGFPGDFFRDSYFEYVTFYCLPDGADFQGSRVANCTFAVCRIRDANFERTRIYDTDFHSCDIQGVSFFSSTMICDEFQDNTLRDVSFREASLKCVYTRDCTMVNADVSNSILNGCDFSRTTAKETTGLDSITITHSGATVQEVAERQRVIRKVLSGRAEKERKPRRERRGYAPEK